MKRRLQTIFFQWLLAIGLFSPLPVISQTATANEIITKRFFSVEDGLASREVFCAIQDNNGFMWFGTRNGLNRYDGRNFRLFTKQNSGLKENRIIQLATDAHNHLFIVYGHPGYARTTMRIEVMDLTTYKLTSLKEHFPDLPFNEDYAYWIASAGGELCFVVSNPFEYWRLTAKGFKKLCEMKSWNEPEIGAREMATANGRFHASTGSQSQFYKDCALLKLTDKLPVYFCTPETTTIGSALDGMLIGPAKERTNRWDDVYRKLHSKATNEKIESIAASYHQGPIYFLSGDFPNALVYRARDGLFLYNFTSLTKLLDNEELSIPNGYALYSYYFDRQNNLWICSAGGLIKMKIEKNLFTHYFTKAQLRDSSDNQARGIYSDTKGTVYASLWNKFCFSRNNENGFLSAGRTNIMYGLCQNMNRIFVADANIYSFDKDKKESLKMVTNVNLKEIWSLDSLSPGKLLVGCTDALLRFDINSHQLDLLSYSRSEIPNVKFVYRFIRRKDKKIWAVAQNGLYLLNENGNTIVDYFGKASSDSSHLFPFEIIHDAYEDRDGIIWFATNGEGLFRWDVNKKDDAPGQAFRQFNGADGLPSDILYRIESDDQDNLWISTDNGLLKFNTSNYKTRIYTTAAGISHNEFNRTSSFKAQDGRIFFGGLNGINAFYPREFSNDSITAGLPLRIISYNKFSGSENKLVDQTTNFLSQNKIVLYPEDRFFTLEFQLLDFEEGKLSYAYMIEGIDKTWNYINENSIRISGLPYGDYNLRIKGQSQNGQWSKKELNIPLKVNAPFYKSTWFIAAMLLAVVFISIFFTRWRTRQLESTNAMLESKVGERTMQLQHSLGEKETLLAEKDVLIKEIHHRVKNNLQVISTLLELQSNVMMDEHLKAALQESQNRVQSIALIHQRLYEHESLGAINMGEFTRDLYSQVSKVFKKEEEKVAAHFDIGDISFDIDTAVPFGLILNELLTNSFKYAFNADQANTIHIGLKKEQELYTLDFRDSGKGLPPEFNFATARSLGIRLVNLLAKQLHGNASYKNDNGAHFIIIFKEKK